ncbi:MAG: Helix-turn-helix domain [Schlesneria sp.]|nr:Helix-turn-helix domain [Schlesneria sp.]
MRKTAHVQTKVCRRSDDVPDGARGRATDLARESIDTEGDITLNIRINPVFLAELAEEIAGSIIAKTRIDSPTLEKSERNEQLLVSTSGAARLLNVSERLLWDMTRPRGPIPCVKVGARILYSVSALREWIAAAMEEQT